MRDHPPGFAATIGVLGERVTWEAVASGTFDLFKAGQAGGALAAMFMWTFDVAEIVHLRQMKRGGAQTATPPAQAEPE